MKKIITLILVLLLAGCSSVDTSTLPYSEYINDENPEVEINFDGVGKVTLQLFPEVAPNTVNNFLELANNEFYNNVIMHRVIADFMIQGGDPQGTGMGGAENNIPGEFTSNGFQNDLSHFRGVISMARSQVYDSASSQFFIVHQDAAFLDGEYAAFGGVVDGFDTLDKIATTETGANDKPIEDITIKSIKVELNGYVMKDTTVIEQLSDDYYLPGEFRNDSNPQVVITFSDDQQITLELFEEVAPITVAHFLKLVEEDFYTDIPTVFINEFLIQMGPEFWDGTEDTIKGEFKSNGVNNTLSHVRGVVSMVRAQDPNSASNHFLITFMDAPGLDGNFAAFGAVVTGFETLDYIGSLEVDEKGYPTEDILIKSIERIQ